MAAGMPAARQALAWSAAVIGGLGYAVLAHYATSASRPGLLEASILVVPVMAFALVAAWRSRSPLPWLALWLLVAAGLVLARHQVSAGTAWVVLAQHAGINIALCVAFARTLVPGSVPMVSRLARRLHGPLSERLLGYTRKVTWAWVAYFALTSLVSVALFTFAPIALWSAFVNFLSPPLLLAMFAGEYLVRVIAIPPGERAGLLQSIASWRQRDEPPRHP